MTTHFVRQGDAGVRLAATLTDAAGAAVNLTGATIGVRLTRLPARAGGTQGAGAVIDAANGAVAYDLTAADTASPGLLEIEWRAVLPAGVVRTLPAVRADLLEVAPRAAPLPVVAAPPAAALRVVGYTPTVTVT